VISNKEVRDLYEQIANNYETENHPDAIMLLDKIKASQEKCDHLYDHHITDMCTKCGHQLSGYLT
jgi:hypothetical protein